jgi:hypothetical protein
MTPRQDIQQVRQLGIDIGRIIHGVGQRLAQAVPESTPQAMDGHANSPFGPLERPGRASSDPDNR